MRRRWRLDRDGWRELPRYLGALLTGPMDLYDAERGTRRLQRIMPRFIRTIGTLTIAIGLAMAQGTHLEPPHRPDRLLCNGGPPSHRPEDADGPL
jgi:hypothetical protein